MFGMFQSWMRKLRPEASGREAAGRRRHPRRLARPASETPRRARRGSSGQAGATATPALVAGGGGAVALTLVEDDARAPMARTTSLADRAESRASRLGRRPQAGWRVRPVVFWVSPVSVRDLSAVLR